MYSSSDTEQISSETFFYTINSVQVNSGEEVKWLILYNNVIQLKKQQIAVKVMHPFQQNFPPRALIVNSHSPTPYLAFRISKFVMPVVLSNYTGAARQYQRYNEDRRVSYEYRYYAPLYTGHKTGVKFSG